MPEAPWNRFIRSMGLHPGPGGNDGITLVSSRTFALLAPIMEGKRLNQQNGAFPASCGKGAGGAIGAVVPCM
jgi:hypothetical protein